MNAIKKTREAQGLRREDLASRASVSLAYIFKLESSTPPNPGLDIARRIAKTLGTTVDKLFPVSAPELAGRR
jgi:transcriptional regulator with XRE-family HTH domain